MFAETLLADDMLCYPSWPHVWNADDIRSATLCVLTLMRRPNFMVRDVTSVTSVDHAETVGPRSDGAMGSS